MSDRERRRTQVLIIGVAVAITTIYLTTHPNQVLRTAAAVTLPVWVLYIWFLLSRVK
jgi:hypothetical protein